MSSSLLQTLGLVLAAVVVFGSGVLLTRSGKPYGSALLNLHKLIDLAAIVVVGVKVYQAAQADGLPALEWGITALTAALFVALLASGGVASGAQAPPKWVLWVHRVAPWIVLALAAATVYLTAT